MFKYFWSYDTFPLFLFTRLFRFALCILKTVNETLPSILLTRTNSTRANWVLALIYLFEYKFYSTLNETEEISKSLTEWSVLHEATSIDLHEGENLIRLTAEWWASLWSRVLMIFHSGLSLPHLWEDHATKISCPLSRPAARKYEPSDNSSGANATAVTDSGREKGASQAKP